MGENKRACTPPRPTHRTIIMHRKTLYNFKNSSECVSKIEELNNTYRKKFNKNSKVDLFYSRSGPDTKPIHAITAYYETEDKSDVAFFESLLNNV